MGKSTKTFDIEVQLTPISGRPTTKTVTVPASATLREVAEAAGVAAGDVGRRNYYVDDKPATSETRVTSASRIKITERPQGS